MLFFGLSIIDQSIHAPEAMKWGINCVKRAFASQFLPTCAATHDKVYNFCGSINCDKLPDSGNPIHKTYFVVKVSSVTDDTSSLRDAG